MNNLKFIKINGIKDYLSPLILSGSLISSGISQYDALYDAKQIIDQVPDNGIDKDDFINLVAGSLPAENKRKYLTLELVKRFILSGRSKSPLFIFLGGLGGKTLLANFISQHLKVSQAVAIDNEKYRLADPASGQKMSWRATYESSDEYKKIMTDLTPWMVKMVNRNLFDFQRYKKWCYIWEGIYLSPNSVREMYKLFENIDFLSVFILPKFHDVRRQYLIRWQSELGVEELEKRKNVIDGYLKNIKAIRGHISDNIDPIASFVIESVGFEERLINFYVLLHQKLKDIADREIPGWVEKVLDKPIELAQFNSFLQKPQAP